MHVDNIASFQKGDLPLPGGGPLHHHCRDYDLKAIKRECDERLTQRNIIVTYEYVKAHQDKGKEKDPKKKPLSQPALMNIDCDK